MQGTEFDEIAFFRALQESGARALLIGRRALVLLGLPVVLGSNVAVQMPAIADLIRTKRIANRPKDLEDIRLLEILRQQEEP